MLTVFETIYNNDLSLPRSQCLSALTWPVIFFDRIGMVLPSFELAKYALKEILYQRSFVRKSKRKCENLARFKSGTDVVEIHA